jgi:hypothetical protein
MTPPETLNSDLRYYQLKIIGQLDEDFVASFCPPKTGIQCESDTTLLSNIFTDQSGIFGIIRHLHNLRCTILEVTTKDKS